MKRILFILIAAQCFLFSCTLEKEDAEEMAETVPNTTDLNGEVRLKKGLILKNIEITDVSQEGRGQQIVFSCDAKASAEIFKYFKDANALIAYVTCSGNEARTYVAGQVFEKTAIIPYDFPNEPVLFNNRERNLEFIIPFRNIELPKGEHNLKFKIEFFEANFKIDAKKKNEGYFLTKRNIPFASWETEQNFTTPELEKIALKINHIALNTAAKDPKTYDIHFSGPGYPDLYWEVKCYGESIYKCPVSPNSVNLDIPYTTPFFMCGPHDKIEIGVYDQDNTSKPDEVEIIRKTMSDISGKTKQGRLQNISVEVIKK